MYYNGDNTVQAEYLYVYSADGQLAKQYAISGGNVVEEYSFEYDSLGRLIRSREDKGSSNVQRTEHLYDTANRLTKQSWNIGGKPFTESYTYNSGDGSLNTVTAPTGDKLSYSYDVLKRPGTTTVKNSGNTTLFTTARSYKTSGNKTTNQISGFSYRNASGGIINYNTYEYDTAGNIKKVYQVTNSSTQLIAEYTYDNQSQLTEEKRYAYSGTGATPSQTTTVEYSYDTAGNIMSREGSDGVYLTYSYDDPNWADLLTGIGISGFMTDISYDDCGNPSNWYNGSSYTNLTWAQGRRLMSLKKGTAQIEYAYDMDGIRTSKIEGSYRHDYVTQNGKVMREMVTNKTTGAFVRCLDFFYDESGNPFAMRRYNNSALTSYDTFHYVLNAQGDVVQINYQGGTVYAKYTYDAWGNVLTATGSLASINPLRYRGYYYDTETGWYYLQSRYYDPAVGRFINADSYASTGQGFIGYNMFSYCGNNPVVRIDASGTGWTEVIPGIVSYLIHAGHNILVSWGIDTAAIGAFFLQMYPVDGVYHASFDCWQQYFGYNDLYDVAFNIGTSMDSAKFEFTRSGKPCILWLWKGDYINLGAGIEAGVYTGGGPHWVADTSLTLNMTVTLKYENMIIASYGANTWWATAFNPDYLNVNANALSASYVFELGNAKDVFFSLYYSNMDDPNWKFDMRNYLAFYSF